MSIICTTIIAYPITRLMMFYESVDIIILNVSTNYPCQFEFDILMVIFRAFYEDTYVQKERKNM